VLLAKAANAVITCFAVPRVKPEGRLGDFVPRLSFNPIELFEDTGTAEPFWLTGQMNLPASRRFM